ncbi:hypothetical protein RFI_19205, partial [Reticulomyxa filosa]
TSANRIEELLQELKEHESKSEAGSKERTEGSKVASHQELYGMKDSYSLLEMANELALFQQLDKAKELYEHLLHDPSLFGWEDLHISYEFFLSEFCNKPKEAESHFLKFVQWIY